MPHVSTMPPDSWNQLPALYFMGPGCVEWFWRWGVEMKAVLFVFWITSYIPNDYLEQCEGKKFFQFKMPYTITRRKWPSFRQALCPLFLLLTVWVPTLPPSPSTVSIQQCYCLSETATGPPPPPVDPPLPHFVNFHSGFTFWYFRPINVYVPISCLYFNLRDSRPALADRDARATLQSWEITSIHWNWQTPKPAVLRLSSISTCTLVLSLSWRRKGLKTGWGEQGGMDAGERTRSTHQMQKSQKSKCRLSHTWYCF